jgi:glyoxylase-like metal-dependent hydrolase (beta-lactamase superfamily II)
MQQIKRGIYYENSYLGVTLGALVFSNGTILIDAPLRLEDARTWRSALLSLRGGTNRILVSLDSHLDRTLGARSLECTLLTHFKTAQAYRNRPVIFKGQNPDSGSDWENYNDVIGTRWASPDITFSQQMKLHWGGPEVILEHHPGASPGAIWVIIPEENVLFVGDMVVADQPPFLATAELDAWLENLDVLYTQYRDYTIVSGRGGLVTREAVRAQTIHLKKISKQLDRLARRGAPPEQTEDLIPGLLKDLSFPPEMAEKYAQRLRTGLYQYYNHQYRADGSAEPVEIEEELE